MKNWEDLSFIQKALIGVSILAIAVFAPEIALLVQFGGIETAFAFLLFAFKPALTWLQHYYCKLRDSAALAVLSIRHSASAKPSVFVLQASFCCAAFLVTGSTAIAFSFLMPGLFLNTILV